MTGRGGFPFRDFLVARTSEPRADTSAMLFAEALALAVGDVAVVRVEHAALERAARHAGLAVVGTPVRRRPAGMPGGDPSALAARIGLPAVVLPPGYATVDPARMRSIVCGARDLGDLACVTAAGALADALDLQLILAHASTPASVPPIGGPYMAVPAEPGSAADWSAARELLGEIARRAGRAAAGASCPRLADGAPAEELCRIGNDEGALLIAVTAARGGRLVSALRGSVARDLLRQADRPVLVWPRRPSPALATGSTLGAQRSHAG
jgi:nucleotide-binding universal stress UspA family protein